MFITGLGTAAPAQRYGQNECWETLLKSKRYYELNPRARAILKKVLNGNSGIHTRHLALNKLSEAFDLTADTLHARFSKHAPQLATEAAKRALADSGDKPEEVDAIII